jgi:hypothetical protein
MLRRNPPRLNQLTHEQGRILEKRLTTETDDFNRFLRTAPESAVPQGERTEREAYRYQKVGSLLMRSQLDCHDPRLPGHGVFDIKTRACLPIRHDRANWIVSWLGSARCSSAARRPTSHRSPHSKRGVQLRLTGSGK